jgi:dienelactone hydrolase
VLHILGGDFPLARLFCNTLAQHGVHALFLKMPYYGPRRDPDSPRRMVSPDPRETVAGMTQAVLDIRRGSAWLEAQPEIDPDRLGIFGISLGGITAALAMAAEPRLQNVCLMLAGGDIGRAILDSPETQPIRERWLAQGGTRDEFLEIFRAVDPVTYAAAARGKRILMLNARDDEVIPRACTESLWKALGQPEIQWYPGGHYSVVRHLFSALLRAGRFFAAET